MNTLLASFSILPESLIVNRIEYLLNHPGSKPPSYLQTFKMKMNAGELYKGALLRINYCLLGTFTTSYLVDRWGSGYESMIGIAAVKNIAVFPPFLASTARLLGYNWQDTLTYTFDGLKSPVMQTNFFFRNFSANIATLWPALKARDYVFQATGEKHPTFSSSVGFLANLILATGFNTLFKPFITGTKSEAGIPFTLSRRWEVARGLAGAVMMALREGCTGGITLFSTAPQGKASEGPEENQPSSASLRKS